MPKAAKNYEDFVEVISEAIRKALNTDIGQKITTELLEMKLKENPYLTKEEWNETKSEFMTWLFCQLCLENSEISSELAEHVWEKLQQEV